MSDIHTTSAPNVIQEPQAIRNDDHLTALIATMPVRDSWPVRVVVGTFALCAIALVGVVCVMSLAEQKLPEHVVTILGSFTGFLAGVLATTSTVRR